MRVYGARAIPLRIAFWADTTTVSRVGYAPSGAILSGDFDGFVRIHDRRTLAAVHEARIHEENEIVIGIVLADERHVISSAYDDTLREWDTASGSVRRIATFPVWRVPLKAAVPDLKVRVLDERSKLRDRDGIARNVVVR